MSRTFSGKKILSMIVCAARTAQIGSAAFAADDQDPRRAGRIDISGSSVSLSQGGGYSETKRLASMSALMVTEVSP